MLRGTLVVMAKINRGDTRKPLTFQPKKDADIQYFEDAWWSGQRGGGSVPVDISWTSNPKEAQEEQGWGTAPTAEEPARA